MKNDYNDHGFLPFYEEMPESKENLLLNDLFNPENSFVDIRNNLHNIPETDTPSAEVINALLNYSKSLEVFKDPSTGDIFTLIMN